MMIGLHHQQVPVNVSLAADTPDDNKTASLTERVSPQLDEPRQKRKRSVAVQAKGQASAQPVPAPRKRQKITMEAAVMQAAVVQPGAKTKSKTADASVPPGLLPMPEEHKEYEHVPGEQAWSALGPSSQSILHLNEHHMLVACKFGQLQLIWLQCRQLTFQPAIPVQPEPISRLQRVEDLLEYLQFGHVCAGHEPYRRLGVTVRENEVLDSESLVNVAKAKALYNKKYREVGL